MRNNEHHFESCLDGQGKVAGKPPAAHSPARLREGLSAMRKYVKLQVKFGRRR